MIAYGTLMVQVASKGLFNVWRVILQKDYQPFVIIIIINMIIIIICIIHGSNSIDHAGRFFSSSVVACLK